MSSEITGPSAGGEQINPATNELGELAQKGFSLVTSEQILPLEVKARPQTEWANGRPVVESAPANLFDDETVID